MTVEDALRSTELIAELKRAIMPPKKAIHVYRAIKQIDNAIVEYREVLDKWIEKEQVKDISINDLTSAQRDYYFSLLHDDIHFPSFSVILTVEDLENTNLSVAALGFLEDIKLFDGNLIDNAPIGATEEY